MHGSSFITAEARSSQRDLQVLVETTLVANINNSRLESLLQI
jgi:hypothetical protein